MMAPQARKGQFSALESFLRFAGVSIPLAGVGVQVLRGSSESPSEATDGSLSFLLAVVLPLAASWAVLRFDPEPQSLEIGLGGSRRRVLLAPTVKVLLSTAGVSIAGCLVAIWWTRGASDPLLRADLFATLPIALGAHLSVFALFLAARVWAGTWGLLAALVACWTLGQADGVVSLLLPGGHTRNLIGVAEVASQSPTASAGALAAMFVGFLGLTFWRIPP